MASSLQYLAYTLALLICWVLCLLARPLGQALGLMDQPGGRKEHPHETPLVGGIAVLVPTLLVALFSLSRGFFPNHLVSIDLRTIYLFAGIIFLVGVIDDHQHLSARLRLFISIIGASIAIIDVPDLKLHTLMFTGQPKLVELGGGTLGFTILCLVGLLNAINMADGKNGLVIGCSCLWAGFLWIYAPEPVRPVLVALILCLLVALVFNLRGRLFLGDGGSYGLAMLLGMLSIYTYNHRFIALSADQIVLWYMIPIIDCVRLLVSRLISRRSPFAPDRNHLHHFLSARWGWGRGKFVYWALVGVPGLLSIWWPGLTLLLIGAVFLFYIALLVRLLAYIRARDAAKSAIVHA